MMREMERERGKHQFIYVVIQTKDKMIYVSTDEYLGS